MAQLNEKRVLVTGGAGFIGFHLCKKLSEYTSNLTIYDNLSSGKLENVKDLPKANFVKGDILDLTKLCSLEKADLIYHLAAQVVVPYSMENPLEDFETNAHGTLNVLEKARKDDARIVFASSAAVYGNPTKLPTPEDYGFNPFSCYGLSKVVGEEYCNMYANQYGLEVTIMRFANVYGSRCHGVINDFLDKLSRNPNRLEIIGTGLQSRDFVHISDIVEALITSVQKEKAIGQTYNLGYGKTTKIIDLAKMILKILDLTNKTVITTTNVSWKGDINTIWFDISKAKKELNWHPKITLEDTLKEMIKERKLGDDINTH
ncbi:NAD-dependent epimerase/dehydratase family protein [Candidatus Bathyarchaeota archaeon A05DMB-2]|jgi:UDP-glucose 4-epimerase|nr:NAD-dependent epimerase/dehydratase family protein [Candidatus Bathyarchaeota archaeon A05DMB-2]